MGYDLRLYFPQEVFPIEEWLQVMGIFHAEQRSSLKTIMKNIVGVLTPTRKTKRVCVSWAICLY